MFLASLAEGVLCEIARSFVFPEYRGERRIPLRADDGTILIMGKVGAAKCAKRRRFRYGGGRCGIRGATMLPW